MKVVALISGGKDSCFNMVLCQHYGHEVVALANLLPTQAEVDDLDSYMYQTVGHQVVAAYATCMGLPLFRRKIFGVSKHQRLVYEDTAGDEVEDLAALLAYVKEQIPGIEAVSSGAIASDYQRTRVERVCARLGLVSLAYLWHQPQDPLLQRMIDAQIEAILVKIAAAGLKPCRHLGASLSAMQPHLRSLRDTYGCNVCGEGGEYETLTLDCPLFTQGRIVLDAWETIMVSEDSMAPVALLHPTAFHVEKKEESVGGLEELSSHLSLKETTDSSIIHVPDEYAAPPQVSTRHEVLDVSVHGPNPPSKLEVKVQMHHTAGSSSNTIVETGPPCVSITAAVLGSTEDYSKSPENTVQALTSALQSIENELSSLGLTWHDALFVHLYVPAMAHFAAANTAYSRYLPAINPPARATVQLAANCSTALIAEVLLRGGQKNDGPSSHLDDTKVLHVQSISEWAPSCIGPYSQAVSHRGLVYFAGQIPLEPPTMAVAAVVDVAAATAQSLRSCQAVAVSMRTDLRYGSLWWTVYCSTEAGIAGREAAATILKSFLDGTLPGDQFLGAVAPAAASFANAFPKRGALGSSDDSENESEPDDFVDEYLLPPKMQRHWDPLVTFIEMPALPRAVPVEVQPVAWSSHGVAPDSSSSSEDEVRKDKQVEREGPRWIGQMEARRKTVDLSMPAGHAEVQILLSSGDLFRGIAFVHALQTVVVEHLGAIAGEVADVLRKEMENGAMLAGADICAVKIYISSKLSPSGVKAIEAIRAAVDASLGQEGISVSVPVLTVGSNAASEALFAIEVFARK